MSTKIRTVFPKSKIKQIMQMDDDVGKIAADVPIMISRSVELFLEELLQNASTVAKERDSDVIHAGHLKECIFKMQQFDFLKPLVEQIVDLVEKQDKSGKTAKLPKQKKARTSDGAKKPRKKVVNEPVAATEPNAELPNSPVKKEGLEITRAPDALETMDAKDNDDEDWDIE